MDSYIAKVDVAGSNPVSRSIFLLPIPDTRNRLYLRNYTYASASAEPFTITE